MNLSILHSFMGDNEIEFDTTTEEGRKRIGEVLNKLLKAGTAIFLERADKTYRVTGWDPATDQLVIQAPGRWPTGEARHAIPEKSAPQLPAAAESLQEPVEAPAPPARKKPGPRKGTVRASTRRGRMTAVAPTAGG